MNAGIAYLVATLTTFERMTGLQIITHSKRRIGDPEYVLLHLDCVKSKEHYDVMVCSTGSNFDDIALMVDILPNISVSLKG